MSIGSRGCIFCRNKEFTVLFMNLCKWIDESALNALTSMQKKIYHPLKDTVWKLCLHGQLTYLTFISHPNPVVIGYLQWFANKVIIHVSNMRERYWSYLFKNIGKFFSFPYFSPFYLKKIENYSFGSTNFLIRRMIKWKNR